MWAWSPSQLSVSGEQDTPWTQPDIVSPTVSLRQPGQKYQLVNAESVKQSGKFSWSDQFDDFHILLVTKNTEL